MRYLALGDSYTIGEGVRSEDSWPFQLVDALRREKIDIEDPIVIAKTGWTTGELLEGIAQANPKGPFDLVTLMVGVNNQYRRLTLNEFGREFKQLLAYATEMAAGTSTRVLAISIPDWTVTPFAQRENPRKARHSVDVYNRSASIRAVMARIKHIDITPASRLAKGDPELLAADGLHPSRKMYDQWSRIVLPFAKQALTSD